MLSWQTTPLRLVDVPVPSPAPGELLVRVLACGVCRTDLHVVDGDLPVHRPSVVPGHQVVGEVVVAAGDFVVGERVGIAWLRHTCESCRFCLRGDENLCPSSLYTGGTLTVVMRHLRSFLLLMRFGCLRDIRTRLWRRCCVRGSSDIGR
ncbi:D-arabinose 1-dehydrogenase-like Zn-dependent alcohol dehydrogenase [Lentzea nigeriaca]|nr:D-arabinose 1-dehydrogenase-like Zn-dependent alcohol dehydrogenase [Lentzea nigeriaca]